MRNPWNVSLKRGDPCWIFVCDDNMPPGAQPKVMRGVVTLFKGHVIYVATDDDDLVRPVHQDWVVDMRWSRGAEMV